MAPTQEEEQLGSLVQQWLAIDINSDSKKKVQDLWDRKELSTLSAMMTPRIAFGTAGLRSKMEPGFAHMNDVTVLQAAQGLVKYLLDIGEDSIVIGYDHRFNSQRFAEISASVALSKGLKVNYLGSVENLSVETLKLSSGDWTNDESASRSFVHTPLVPFAVDYYHAGAGVMVTASHNPAQDNGYKVYYKNGCQIIPPHDKEIAERIDENLQIWPEVEDVTAQFKNGLKSGLLNSVKEIVVEEYLHRMESIIQSKTLDYEFVYTPMHGVGLEIVEPVLDLFAGSKTLVVDAQAHPDPTFSTVKFPNPEEKGALDLAIAQAEKNGQTLVVATDPDADRFSVAIKEGDEWQQLTGNEIGFLFAMFIIESTDKAQFDNLYLVNSTVSSQILKAMADYHGFKFIDTLTGFKWIGNKAIDLKSQGHLVPFGYEEAIGYMFSLVNDKDGVSALAMWLQLYQKWFSKGLSVISKLHEGYQTYGWHKECNGYYRVNELSQTKEIFTAVRLSYEQAPTELDSFKVVSWRDLTIGYDSSTPDKKAVLPVDPTSQMITGELQNEDGQVRFTVRGSGTEPKIKVYIEGKAKSEKQAISNASACWASLRHHWFKNYQLTEVQNK